jgi:hypothetical protein
MRITRGDMGLCCQNNCRDDHKLADRPIYGVIPKVVDSQMLQKMRKESETVLNSSFIVGAGAVKPAPVRRKAILRGQNTFDMREVGC